MNLVVRGILLVGVLFIVSGWLAIGGILNAIWPIPDTEKNPF